MGKVPSTKTQSSEEGTTTSTVCDVVPLGKMRSHGLMERAKREQLQFHVVLDLLRQATNRYETSFASKLIATINPSMPVIDSIVLKNLGLRLPYSTATNRALQICKLHQKLTALFGTFLSTEDGKYLVEQFKAKYPNANITEVKMLDLVLWQTRA